ncbi:hypothetical protein KSP40_PGU018143 [Platanthera guangdongensis]|uniref:Pentatricopeptide repeat-containing protein n=1 Tax=Platanthera guangdongensis TaxID=2320717 RepID=A0ABR2LSA8_9ASPA
MPVQPAGLPWLHPSFQAPEIQVATSRKILQCGDGHPKISNTSIIRAISIQNANPKQIISLFTAAARQRGFRPDLSTFASLLPFLLRHRRIRAAELLLRRFPITGQRPGPSLLLPLASSALTAGIPCDSTARLILSAHPSASAFSSLLRALLRSSHLTLARSLIITAVPDDLGFQIKIRHFAGLVREYCRLGYVNEAEDLVVQMGRKGLPADADTYNALIASVCDHCSVDRGFRVYLAMEDIGVSPDVITFSTLMGRVGMQGWVLGCNCLFGRMLVMGALPDWSCYRILVGVYCKNCCLSDAIRVFRAMKRDGFLDDVRMDSILDCECEEAILCYVLKSGIIGGLMG